MAWTIESDICIAVHVDLKDLEQISKTTPFETTGQLTMKQLQFFNTSATTEFVRNEATGIAVLIDEIFIDARHGIYKGDFDKNAAISAMVVIMIDEDKTVEELSDQIDKIYQI